MTFVERRSLDTITLSRNPIKLAIWGVILLCVLWLVGKIFTTVLIFSLALLIAYLVTPAVAWLSSKRLPGAKGRQLIPWPLATLIVYLLISGILIFLIAIFVPITITQANALGTSMPQYIHKVDDFFKSAELWREGLHISPETEANLEKYGSVLLGKTSPLVSTMAKSLANGILECFTALLIFIAAFIFSLYIVLEEKQIRKLFLDMFPQPWREDTEELLRNSGKVVGGFIRGILNLSVITGIFTYLALLPLKFFGISYDYSLLTAIAVALLYPIPFIGAWLPRFAGGLLAYLQTGNSIVAVWVFMIVSTVGLLSENFIFPLVMGKGIGVSPLMVLFAMFAGGELFGLWGLILSVPAVAIIRLLFFYIQKHVTI